MLAFQKSNKSYESLLQLVYKKIIKFYISIIKKSNYKHTV